MNLAPFLCPLGRQFFLLLFDALQVGKHLGRRFALRRLSDEQRFEFLNLIAQISNQLDIRVLVDRRRVDYVLGAVRIAQRAQRLGAIDIGRRYGGDHDGFAVAAEAVFEDSRER